MKAQRGFVLTDAVVAFWLLLWLAGGVGYLVNVYKLVRMCCEVNGWLVTRSLGIVIPPLGAVVGFL